MRSVVSLVSLLSCSAIFVFSAGCGETQAARARSSQNNYSQIPCADNCGGDATCMATCTPTGPGANTPAQPMEFTHGGK